MTPDGDVAGARGVAGGGPGRACRCRVARRGRGRPRRQPSRWPASCSSRTAASATPTGSWPLPSQRPRRGDRGPAGVRQPHHRGRRAPEAPQHELARTTEQLDGLRWPARPTWRRRSPATRAPGRAAVARRRSPTSPTRASRAGRRPGGRAPRRRAGRGAGARGAGAPGGQRRRPARRGAPAAHRRPAGARPTRWSAGWPTASARRLARLDAIARCGVLADVAAQALVRTDRSLIAAGERRDAFEEDRADAQRRLGVVRARRDEVGMALTRLRDDRHARGAGACGAGLAADHVRARLHGLGRGPRRGAGAARRHAARHARCGGEERDASWPRTRSACVRRVGCSAPSTRWRSRSSPRPRSATTSSRRSSPTCAPAAATCWR